MGPTNAAIPSEQAMLILTRRVGETIRIGDDIRLTVIDCTAIQVRVGIKAPSHIAVHREEVYERIQCERSLSRTDK